MHANPAIRFTSRKYVIAACVLALLDTAWVLALGQWSRAISSSTFVQSSGAVAVLFSDSGPILKRTARSLDRAVDMRTKHPDLLIVCVGGNRTRSGQAWGDRMADYLVAKGVSKQSVIRDQSSFDTRTNILALRDIVAEKKQRALYVIVHPAHGPRTRYYLRTLAPEIDASIIFAHPIADDGARIRDFWFAAQHEILGWIAIALPDNIYARLITHLRR